MYLHSVIQKSIKSRTVDIIISNINQCVYLTKVNLLLFLKKSFTDISENKYKFKALFVVHEIHLRRSGLSIALDDVHDIVYEIERRVVSRHAARCHNTMM